MQQNLEIEVKTLLSYQDFQHLINYFKLLDHDFRKQINYYFDTPTQEISKKFKATLRIRQIDHNYMITLKEKTPLGTNELEQEIDESTFNLLINNKLSFQNFYPSFFSNKKIDSTTIILVGSLTTYRSTIKYLQGELFFDINHYQNQIDYEIEYESYSYEYANQTLGELFKQLNLEFKVNNISKRQRALKG